MGGCYNMNTFKQFISEDQWHGGKKRKFENGNIVLVTGTPHGATKLNSDARPYLNQIGFITGYKPRSMASPFYEVQFDNGQKVMVIAIFLRGPYVNREAAEKYKANPTTPDDPKDLLYHNTPKPQKELIKYGRNFKIEKDMHQHFSDTFTFLSEPKELVNPVIDSLVRRDNNIYFTCAYEPIINATRRLEELPLEILDGKPCHSIIRVNNGNTKKLDSYYISTIRFQFPSRDVRASASQYVLFPFDNRIIDTRRFYTSLYDANIATQCNEIKTHINILQIFNDLTTQKGDDGYREFFFDNQIVRDFILDPHNGRGVPTYSEYRKIVMQGLLASGKSNSKALSKDELGWIL